MTRSTFAPPARILLLVCAVISSCFLLYGWEKPINDPHSFRQSQTAISAYWMVGNPGTFADYVTPVFGLPEAIPFEAPYYQYLMARAHEILPLSLDSAGRFLSIAMFFLIVWLSGFLAREAGLDGDSPDYIRVLLLSSPLYLFWSRAVMIESTALFLGVFGIYSVLKGTNRRSYIWLLIGLTAGSLASTAKVTTWAVSFGCCTLLLSIRVLDGLRTTDVVRRRQIWLWASLGLLAAIAPLIPAKLWVAWTDEIKSANEFGRHLMSNQLASWNFGTWSQRLDKEFYVNQLGLVRRYLLSWEMVPGTLLLLVLGVRASRWAWRGWLSALAFFAAFLSGPVVFSNLYAVHSYYWYANGVWLVFALGAVLAMLPQAKGIWRLEARHLAVVIVGSFALLGYASWWNKLRPLIRDHEVAGTVNRPSWDQILEWRRMIQAKVAPEERLLVFSGGYSSFWNYYSERKGLSYPSYHSPRVLQRETEWLEILSDPKRTGRLGAMFVEHHEWKSRSSEEWAEIARLQGFAPAPVPSPFGQVFFRKRD